MKAPPTPSILVTGGAGYIGSHTVRMLSDLGQRVVVLDNLSEGHRDALINEEVELVVANLGDSQEMEALFSQHSFWFERSSWRWPGFDFEFYVGAWRFFV